MSMKTDDNTIPCDINGDEIISIADAVAVQNYLLGRLTETIGNTDINNDNSADVFDYIIMRKIIADNLYNLPYEFSADYHD